MSDRRPSPLAPEGLGAEAVELLQRLIRFNTVNPPGNEAEAQQLPQWPARRGGLGVRAAVGGRGPPEPGRAAARRGRGADAGADLPRRHRARPIPPSGPATPGAATCTTDYVWGRGALDMKDQVASETAACLRPGPRRVAPGARRPAARSSAPTRRPAPSSAPSGSAASRPRRCAATWSSTRAPGWRSTSTAAASSPWRWARRASFASSSAPTASPATPRFPASATTPC